MNKAIVIVLVLAIIGAAGFVIISMSDQSGDVQGELTFYIEEVGGDTLTAGMPFGALSFGDQMMLAWGQPVQATQFEALDYSGGEEIPELKSTAYYNVWVCATIHLTANDDIVEITESRVTFFGFTTFPEHGVILTGSTYTTGVTDSVDFEGYLVANQDVSIDMAVDSGKKFTHKMLESSAPTTSQIQGANINGMKLYCQVNVKGLDSTGAVVSADTLGEYTLTVGDWIEPELTVSITGMGKGSDYFTIMPFAMFVPMLGITIIGRDEGS